MAEHQEQSLYEQIGGRAGMERIVPGLYSRVVLDPLLSPYFADADAGTLLCRLYDFLSFALGGPTSYFGQGLREAHAHLVHEGGIDDTHFDSLKKHVAETLQDMNLRPDQTEAALAVIEATRKDVLCR